MEIKGTSFLSPCVAASPKPLFLVRDSPPQARVSLPNITVLPPDVNAKSMVSGAQVCRLLSEWGAEPHTCSQTKCLGLYLIPRIPTGFICFLSTLPPLAPEQLHGIQVRGDNVCIFNGSAFAASVSLNGGPSLLGDGR